MIKLLLTKKKYLFVFLLLISPFFMFIATMHGLAFNSGLSGYRGGPMDAFRHSLASAYVARYVGKWAVVTFTDFTERNHSSKYDVMDMHNNNVGVLIGTSDTKDIYDEVKLRVSRGKINSQEAHVITWLPENKWASPGHLLGL